MNRGDVTRLIYDVIDDLNTQLPNEGKLEKSNDLVLLGSSGKLDSLGLVNLIVGVEEKIEDDLGFTISLADEKAMSQQVSPFKTVRTLADYITVLLSETSNA